MKILSISAAIFVIDQITKYLTKTFMTLRESIPVIGDTVRLTYIENYGMAFGISIGNKVLFNFFSLFAAAAIFYYLIKMRNNHFVPRFALAIIFGGALGNLVDRIIYGRVVDFVDVNIPNIPAFDLYFLTIPPFNRWPIFNVADMAVSCGMFLLILTIIMPQSVWSVHEISSDADPVPVEEKIQK
ncbi:signal peptidase II [candidate division KSB1 bacterium]